MDPKRTLDGLRRRLTARLDPDAGFGTAPAPKPRGFAEDARGLHEAGLRDLEARIPPPEATYASPPRPAFRAGAHVDDRLSPEHAAGGGMIVDAEGRRRPHYHGHRARLRERFLAGGADALPDYELLELLLFDAIPRIDVKPLAKRLLARFGHLSAVVAAPDAQIMQVEGSTDRVVLRLRMIDSFARRIGRAKIVDKTALSSWDDLVAYCRTAMAFRQTEAFRVLFLDKKNALIGNEVLGTGTVDHTPAYPREVIRRAIELSATAVVLVHNHPSGDPTPSRADVEMTQRIIEAGEPLGLIVHDHVVMGRDGHASLKGLGLI